jgi:hypothetical protein
MRGAPIRAGDGEPGSGPGIADALEPRASRPYLRMVLILSETCMLIRPHVGMVVDTSSGERVGGGSGSRAAYFDANAQEPLAIGWKAFSAGITALMV